MSDYICPYLCSYRTNSGFCGYTGGHGACQWRKIKGFNYETKRFYAEPVGSYEEAYNLTPKTNADRIRSMSDEELAKYLAWLEDEQACYQWEMYGDTNRISEWCDWLKAPADKEVEE